MMDIMRSSHPFGFARHNDMMKSPPVCSFHAEQEQRQQPQRRAMTQTTTCPSEHSCPAQKWDILCGRDKLSYSHEGNKRFRELVLTYREEYQTAPSREIKSKISCHIVAFVKQRGGRFLKQDDVSGAWKEVSSEYAHEKVSHALRSAKDPNRPRVKKQREPAKYVPTTEENALFEKTLADQQRIFEGLVSQADKGLIADINFDDIESLLSTI
jgi:hypothetical protein